MQRAARQLQSYQGNAGVQPQGPPKYETLGLLPFSFLDYAHQRAITAGEITHHGYVAQLPTSCATLANGGPRAAV
jgi:hypothetical protein